MSTDHLVILGIIVTTLYLTQMSIASWYSKKYRVRTQDWIFNLNLSYTSKELYHSLSTMPRTLKTTYIKLDILDSIFTILCGIVLTILSIKIITAVTVHHHYLAYSFAIVSLCNLIENALLVTIYASYPAKHPGLVKLASLFTKTKFAFIALGGFILILYLILYLTI